MKELPRVLLILKPSPARESLSQVLEAEGFKVDSTESTFRGISGLARQRRDIIFFGLDDLMDEELEAIKVVRQDCPESYIVVTFSHVNRRKGRAAMGLGADAYILEPLNVDEARALLTRFRPGRAVSRPVADAVESSEDIVEPEVKHAAEPSGRGIVPQPERRAERVALPAHEVEPISPTAGRMPVEQEPLAQRAGEVAPVSSEPAASLSAGVGRKTEEHLVNLRKLGASVAHEINNPLTTLSGWIQLLLRKVNGNQDMHRTLLSMKEEADRIADIVRDLTAITEPHMVGRVTLEINELMHQVIECFRTINGNASIHIKTVPTEKLGKVSVDLELMTRAVSDLLNSRYLEVGSSGSVVFRTTVTGGGAELSVYEPGSQVNLSGFHKALATLDLDAGDHIGDDLGLARAKQILDSHQASFQVAADPEEGLSFVVKLPLVE